MKKSEQTPQTKKTKINGRWDTTEEKLKEQLRKIEEEKAAKEQKLTMKVQREFAKVDDAKDEFRHIVIKVKGIDEEFAAEYIDDICAKMTELDDEYEVEYKALKCPDIDKENMSYADMISFPKEKGLIAAQRKYVGKLMTEAMAILNKE